MFRLLIILILGLLIYFAFRRAKRATLIYCMLLVVTFIPTIPIFFTNSNYSSTLLRDSCIILFFAIVVASLIQRGISQRVLASLLSLLILLKGPLFGIHFPPTYDLSDKIEVKTFDFENYSLTLERIKQPPDPSSDIYEWEGEKISLGRTSL